MDILKGLESQDNTQNRIDFIEFVIRANKEIGNSEEGKRTKLINTIEHKIQNSNISMLLSPIKPFNSKKNENKKEIGSRKMSQNYLSQIYLKQKNEENKINEKDSQGQDIIKESSVYSKTSIGENLMVINNYLLEDSLGKGSFSQVIQATNKETGMKFAIKLSSKSSLRKKFYMRQKYSYFSLIEKEFQIMKKLNHQNIIKVLDNYKLYQIIRDQENQRIFMVLQYCKYVLIYQQGAIGSKYHLKYLRANNKIRQNQTYIPQHLLKYYFRQIINGLQYCITLLQVHNNAFIAHQDIKPDNILIAENDAAKIGDFGVACICDKNEEIDKKNAGTRIFMAPETQNEEYQKKPNDIWAIGISIYYLFYRKFPFEIKQNSMKKKVIDYNEINYTNENGITQDMINFIRLCLRFKPKERPKIEELKVV